MTSSVLIPLLAVTLLVAARLLRRLAERDPDKPWVIILFRLWVGPRTDVAYMTKAHLLDSGFSFVTWGFIFMSLLLAVGIVGQLLKPRGDLPVSFFVLLWLLMFFAGMGFLGGAYLLARGAMRSPNWSPPKE
jgi:hypothetical protein